MLCCCYGVGPVSRPTGFTHPVDCGWDCIFAISFPASDSVLLRIYDFCSGGGSQTSGRKPPAAEETIIICVYHCGAKKGGETKPRTQECVKSVGLSREFDRFASFPVGIFRLCYTHTPCKYVGLWKGPGIACREDATKSGYPLRDSLVGASLLGTACRAPQTAHTYS